MWGAIIGGVVGAVSGSDKFRGMGEDARVSVASGLRLDAVGLSHQFNSDFFIDRSMTEWAKAKTGSVDARSFLRTVSLAVGAIDAGYRSRGDKGNADALAAVIAWAGDTDRAIGSAIGGPARAQDAAGFINAVKRIRPAAPVTSPTPIPGPAPVDNWQVGGSFQLKPQRNTNLIVGGVALALVVLLALLLRGSA